MTPHHAIVRDSEGGAVLMVHVQPKAARTECVGIHGDALKIRVATPPHDDDANNELIRFIAGCCAVPRTHVRIQAGAGARHKRLHVKGVTAEWLWARLMPQGEKGPVKA